MKLKNPIYLNVLVRAPVPAQGTTAHSMTLLKIERIGTP